VQELPKIPEPSPDPKETVASELPLADAGDPLAIDVPPDVVLLEPTLPDPNRRSRLWRALQIPARIGCSLLFELKAYGVHNVPETGGVLLASNHQSYLDPVLVAVKLKRPVAYFAKSELFENRFFGSLIRSLHAFPVKMGRNDKGAMELAIRRLREGYALNIYPEGSRTYGGEIGTIMRGIGLVVRRAKVPVLPTAIHGSYEAWPRQSKLFRPHPIRVAYGKPMILHDLPPEKIVTEIGEAIGRLHEDLRVGRVPRDSR
jgi:1-acyl-sn-glycerol-3-phosphate acyltransferase